MRLVGPSGRVVAVDLLPMEAIAGVEFLLGDFTTPETLAGTAAARRGERPSTL